MHNSHNREKARKMSFRSSPSPRKHCLSTGHRTFMGRSEMRGLAHHKINVTLLQTPRSTKVQISSLRTDREPGPGGLRPWRPGDFVPKVILQPQQQREGRADSGGGEFRGGAAELGAGCCRRGDAQGRENLPGVGGVSLWCLCSNTNLLTRG